MVNCELENYNCVLPVALQVHQFTYSKHDRQRAAYTIRPAHGLPANINRRTNKHQTISGCCTGDCHTYR